MTLPEKIKDWPASEQKTDKSGIRYWDSPFGAAYSKTPPPSAPPMTQAGVDALEDGAEVLVLWCGGNGPHKYEVRVLPNGSRHAAPPTGSPECVIRGWRAEWHTELAAIGDQRYQTKVWRA